MRPTTISWIVSRMLTLTMSTAKMSGRSVITGMPRISEFHSPTERDGNNRFPGRKLSNIVSAAGRRPAPQRCVSAAQSFGLSRSFIGFS